jgi:hypothetical protein
MSSEIVRFEKKEVLIPESNLRSETAPNGLYQTPVSYELEEKIYVSEKLTNKDDWQFGALLSMCVAGPAGIAFTIPAIDGNPILFLGTIAVAAGTGIMTFLGVKKDNKATRIDKVTKEINARALLKWLKNRYDISVTTRTAVQLAAYVDVEKKKFGLLCHFSDVDNVIYALHNDVRNRRYVLKVDDTPTDASIESIVKSAPAVSADSSQYESISYLSEDSLNLVKTITSTIERIRNTGLTTEQQYEAEHVLSELKKTCDIRRQIFDINPKKEESPLVKATLEDLHARATKIMDEQVSGLEKELLIQNDYIHSRADATSLQVEK